MMFLRLPFIAGALFCAVAAWAADEIKPEHAYGPGSMTLPQEALQVPEVEFRRMLGESKVRLTHQKAVKAHEVESKKRVKDDEDLVRQKLAQHPEILARLTRKPSPQDPFVKTLPDGNYQVTIRDTQGKTQQIVTMGDEFLYGALANSIRKFPEHKNQHAAYAAMYKGLPDKYKQQKQLPRPEAITHYTADQLIALNTSITTDLLVIYPTLVLDPKPLGYPASCATEIGYDSRNTDRTGGSCAHNANGLFQNASYSLKWYATCVKNQGNRGTCVSFGVTASVETKIALKRHKWMNLSEEDLYNKAKMTWYPSTWGDGLNTAGIVDDINNRNYTFPYELSWNYNPSYSRIAHPATHTYTNSCVGYTGAYCSNTNHQGQLVCTRISIFGTSYTFCGYRAPTPGSSGEQATVVSQLWNPANPSFSTALLALAVSLKLPATIALPVTPTFDGAPATGFQSYLGTAEGNRGWHAVQVIGYVPNTSLPAALPKGSGGGWFVIKNSWGACWKDAGYIYLSYDWVKNYVGSASIINDVI